LLKLFSVHEDLGRCLARQ